MGKHRCIPRMPLDVHDDRSLGLGPGGARVGGPRASPWGDPNRRPSHADKRGAWRRELLAEEIRAVLRPGVTEEEIQVVAERLLSLAA